MLWGLVLLTVLAIVATLLISPRASSGSGAEAKTPVRDVAPRRVEFELGPEGAVELEPSEDGAYDYGIVGEYYRREDLDRLLGDQRELRARALLRAEPDNEHDPFAVAVHIGKMKVGYLPSTDAESLHEFMEELGSRRRRWSCDALASRGDDGAVQVRLKVLAPPEPA